MSPTIVSHLRLKFFEYLFGSDQGYICIAYSLPRDRKSFAQRFYKWPAEKTKLANFIDKQSIHHNVWYGVNLLKKPERVKENCLPTNLVWADLDTCKPDDVTPVPQCAVQSSPGRYQAIWRLEDKVDPYVAENYSKRIAYAFQQNGADPSGWDLTQLLRVPETTNFKYGDTEDIGDPPPKVSLLHSLELLLPPEVFESIELPPDIAPMDDNGAPIPTDLPEADHIIYKYLHNLDKAVFKDLYYTEPSADADWSKIMWRLINICLEAGMTPIEVFAVVQDAGCNKYKRDDRSYTYLWREVAKADQAHSQLTIITGHFQPLVMPDISPDKSKLKPTFIDDYVDWARDATDAVEDYHELGAFIMLSGVMASGLRLVTNYEEMIPNLWGLVLGDSTLTRKTTAMRMAMEFIREVDSDIILATDGSAEGLLQGLSSRPKRTSIFFKDEISGFISAISKKDYLAGMSETLTQLYDVPASYTRMLRKEIITVTSPIFIFFGGGIRDKVYSLLSDDHVLSGFLPRFLIVGGNADLSTIRTTGPRTHNISAKRNLLRDTVSNVHALYNKEEIVAIGDSAFTVPVTVEAILSPTAWEHYGAIEMEMIAAANGSPIAMYAMPTFERLSRSLLKMAILLAAVRQTPQDGLIGVDENDIDTAAHYIQKWGPHTIDLVQNAGKGTTQRAIDRTLKAIEGRPGITRSTLMQAYHLTKREADEILNTLDDRGQIRLEKSGRGYKIYPL